MDTVPAIMELKERTDSDKFTTHCGKGHEGAKEGAVVDNQSHMGRDHVCEKVASQVRCEVEGKWVVVSDSLVLTS